MESKPKLVQKFSLPSSPLKIFVTILIVALIAGVTTGYILASTGNHAGGVATTLAPSVAPKSAQQDTSTFRDFAEGTIQRKPVSSDDTYSEGTHLLIRPNAVPVALTSSVVDLDQYVGKKVKVYGETQKALQEGWLMDVGRVDVE